ncbi:uncharacterized protein LOC114933683 [Nylanderia fulva]|uniref:uncharacterized protein LOC114933683 n=1 Tax=Nylanderia fulva TaxID=613905 RepID=UPI0010FB2D2B|nr:uncharacterized protein LOC114933683 [Nylanderia fulva]
MASTKIVQANVNHARNAQDLLAQTMCEESYGIAIVAEPYNPPKNNNNWVVSEDGTAAIVRRNASDSPPLNPKDKGEGFAVVSWGPITVISVYILPNMERRKFGKRLMNLERQIIKIKHSAGPLVVAGDFNAKNVAWGSPRTDWRGGEVYEWAARSRLDLLNTGRTETCWRRQGGSIVDLTWATRTARRLIHGWRVETEKETDSDHRYITFSVSTLTKEVLQRRLLREAGSKRWALRKIDEDAFLAAINAALIVDSSQREGLEKQRAWLQNVITQACDVAMPRVKNRPKKQAYWWSQDIAELRRSCDQARRKIHRRKRQALLDPEGLEDA